MIKDKHQYHVCGWMINQLHLDGRELQCYAIIYSLSQLGEGRYIAGLKFLAEFMQCTQPTASSAIKGLFAKGLIKKDDIVTECGRRVFYYCADPDIEEEESTNNLEGCKNNPEGVNKKFMDGVNKKFMPKYNKEENKKEYNKRLSNDNQKDELFEKFWSDYGRKGSKARALKEWNRLKDKEKQLVVKNLPDYLLYCKRKQREMKDASSYLHQEYYAQDWNIIPDYYKVYDTDIDRIKRFKEYMVNKFPDLIYHRNPLTFEQCDELFDEYGVGPFEEAMKRLCGRDIHQYYSIKSGVEHILKEVQDDNI